VQEINETYRKNLETTDIMLGIEGTPVAHVSLDIGHIY
jgi:hypothetical protein